MQYHSLQVMTDGTGGYRWTILAPTEDWNVFTQHSAAEEDFQSYADALNAGTLALAAADGESYENEAADPVGDADGAAAIARLG